MSDAPRPVARPALAGGAVALLFLSFLMSGNGSALPQVFLQRHAPQDKTWLLSLALLLSTVAAVIGVALSRRVQPRPTVVAACMGLVIASVQALLSAAAPAPFIALMVVVQFATNFLVDQVDRGAVMRAGRLLAFSDTAGNAARLCGMLAAPAFFTVFAQDTLLQRWVVAALGAAAFAGSWSLFRIAPPPAPAATLSPQRSRPDTRDRVLFGFAIAVYAGMYLFAANMIYLLQDLFAIAGAEQRGGALIVLVFFCAFLSNLAAGAIGRSRDASVGTRTMPLAAPAVAMLVAASAPLAGVRHPGYAMCAAASALVGTGYGVFLWELRRHVSRGAAEGKTALIGWFNNMANVSSLCAFALMLVLSRGAAGAGYYGWLLWTIVAAQLAGLAALAGRPGARRVRSQPAA